MAKVIEGLYYSESHEYVRVEGNTGFIGITDYAQNALGNVVYVDMPDVDDEITAGEDFGAVESVKAASDLLSPVSGTVLEVNEALEDQPELINQDAFENWIIKVELSDTGELDQLMDAKAYEAFCNQ
ncbi:glycine cleavage system protein H [Prevotella sp. P3-120]|jgi:glycine cleavage system H protein|uniref:Glycine cleavage system H protein n=1 Tax=Xylanibacter brevis TaxID=83231 RepID=A0ABS9CG31_9BACT|nr:MULTISPECIES: glycine cleavage system protein GcvH [Prevotellaceae]MBS7318487.1 glycine cleavage system protein GcvH [Prevotella sp.]MCF2560480.1 glycine cleavage system protein GcvH [Xylanibacter brevis]MCF2564056.1 glycine cleavage system protein GcvH [Xylanibacter brevis]MCI7001067.1 glycine cleavage system protein GcvH [Prevotella sp.]MDD7171518.1 glycine cleavage system protein GcvH [Prevotella sp.]